MPAPIGTRDANLLLTAVSNPLEQLPSVRDEIAQVRGRLSALRALRDSLIHDAVKQGATEREAAEQAGVSSSFAHRCAVYGRFARLAPKSR